MDIRWLSAFIDLGPATFDAGVSFWRQVTRSQLSPARGDHAEFATLIPPDGDPYLRVQRTLDGSRGVHLDLHVTSIRAARDRAESLGAVIVEEPGHVIMASPAGLSFCFVGGDEPAKVPTPTEIPAPHRVDQVSIDVPADAFESERNFWSHLTGWPARDSALAEYVSFPRPPNLPLRLLLQRLGADDTGGVARAHLDIACGDGIDQVAATHLGLGATHVRTTDYWITMRDPGGLEYCLTRRDPITSDSLRSQKFSK